MVPIAEPKGVLGQAVARLLQLISDHLWTVLLFNFLLALAPGGASCVAGDPKVIDQVAEITSAALLCLHVIFFTWFVVYWRRYASWLMLAYVVVVWGFGGLVSRAAARWCG